jgi:atypical dual specificity phosphatase
MTDDDVVIKRGGGFIGAFGSRIDRIANELNQDIIIANPTSSSYHITLITKDELRHLTSDSFVHVDELFDNATRIDTKHILSLGVGGDPNAVCWLVILWNAGNMFRKKHGLSCKQFHITLTSIDDHKTDKSHHSLRQALSIEQLNLNLIDHLILSCYLTDQYEQAYVYACDMCRRFPNSEKSWLRLADTARHNQQHKLAMLAFAQAMQLTNGENQEKVQDYCCKKIVQCASNHTEWGCLFVENELNQIPEELKPNLFLPWSSAVRQRLINVYSNEKPQMTQNPREHLLMPWIDKQQKGIHSGRRRYLLVFILFFMYQY